MMLRLPVMYAPLRLQSAVMWMNTSFALHSPERERASDKDSPKTLFPRLRPPGLSSEHICPAWEVWLLAPRLTRACGRKPLRPGSGAPRHDSVQDGDENTGTD